MSIRNSGFFVYGCSRGRTTLSSLPPPGGQEVKGTRDRDTSFAILSGQYRPVILPYTSKSRYEGDLPFPSAFPLLSLAVLRQPPSLPRSRANSFREIRPIRATRVCPADFSS